MTVKESGRKGRPRRGAAARMALVLVAAAALAGLLLVQCAPSRKDAARDVPRVPVEVVDGKEVKLEVYLYFLEVHTRHQRALYQKRLSGGIARYGFVNLHRGSEVMDFLREETDHGSLDYWFGLAESGTAGEFGVFADRGVDYVVIFKGHLTGGGRMGPTSAVCRVYLVDTRVREVTEFSDFEYDVQTFHGVYRNATEEFFDHADKAFVEAYKKKVEAAR